MGDNLVEFGREVFRSAYERANREEETWNATLATYADEPETTAILEAVEAMIDKTMRDRVWPAIEAMMKADKAIASEIQSLKLPGVD